MKKAFSRFCYRIVVALVWLFSPKMKTSGRENIPEGPAVFVGNHSQMFGPIACEIHFPVDRYTWCAGEMMHAEEVAAYAYRDFWSQKPENVRWFYKLLSHLIVPLSVCVFNNARTVPVYHDARIITTMKTTLRLLEAGESVVIFPEHDVKYNHILYDFQERFVDLGKMYFRITGKALPFVPLYIAPNLGRMVLGEPVMFDPAAPIQEERGRICQELKDRITAMAEALPLHTVVPYRNIPKRQYPKSRIQGDAHP